MNDKWKIVDAIYKGAVLLLLLIAVILLRDIKSQQQRTSPTVGDLQVVSATATSNPNAYPQARQAMLESVPVVKVVGTVTVDRIERPVEINR